MKHPLKAAAVPVAEIAAASFAASARTKPNADRDTKIVQILSRSHPQ